MFEIKRALAKWMSHDTYRNYWTTDFGGYVDRTIPC